MKIDRQASRGSTSRYRYLRCMCCDQDYAVQLGTYTQQCNCSSEFCRRCNRCKECCKCEEGFLEDRRPKKFRCYDCSGIVQGDEKFCPHCGVSFEGVYK